MTDLQPAGVHRRDFLRYTGLLGAAATITAGLAACGGPSSSGAGAGGDKNTIHGALAYALSGGFDPMSASSAVAVAANLHVLEPLVDLDPVSRQPYNALAKDTPSKIDGTHYSVTLRDGATFHDGSPVTADDVVFSFERIMDKENASLFAQFLSFLKGVRKTGERTVEFTLKYDFALFAERLSVVRIVPKKIVQADQKKFDSLPVGSGPYKLTAANAGDGLSFAKFGAYNGPRPAKAAKMTWLLLTDPSARVTALQSDRVQTIEAVPYLNADALSKTADVRSVQSFGLLFLMFNCKVKPFDDVRVRQALHYAMDTEKLIKTALLGNASAATSFLQPGHPDHVKAATVYGYDPAKAKRMLAEAGVSGLKVELLTTDTDFVKDCAPLIKQSWDAVGVSTTLNVGQSGGQYANRVDTGKYQVMAAPGDPSVFGNDVDLLMRWFYVGTWPETRSYNSGTAEAKKVVELLDQAARESDDAARKRLWGQAIDTVAEQAALYPIFHRKLVTAWNGKALTGFQPMATTGLSFLNVGRA